MEALGVLAHFERGNCNTASIRRFRRCEQNAVLEEVVNRFERGRHVGAFADDAAAVRNQTFRGFKVDFALRRARQGDVALDVPDATAAFVVLGFRMNIFVLGNSAALFFLDVFDGDDIDTVRVVNVAVRVGAGNDFGAKFLRLLNRVNRHVAGAADNHGLIFEVDIFGVEHIFDEVQQAVAGRLGARQTAAVSQALARENCGIVSVANALVLPEKIANLAPADTNVTGRNVDVRTNVAVEFGHEALAEFHNFVVGLALRVEVGTALAAANRQTRQRIFENLLEREELQNAEVDTGVETQAALVRTNRRVHLDAVAAVDVSHVLVVLPRHAEGDDAFRLNEALQKFRVAVLRILFQERHD